MGQSHPYGQSPSIWAKPIIWARVHLGPEPLPWQEPFSENASWKNDMSSLSKLVHFCVFATFLSQLLRKRAIQHCIATLSHAMLHRRKACGPFRTWPNFGPWLLLIRRTFRKEANQKKHSYKHIYTHLYTYDMLFRVWCWCQESDISSNKLRNVEAHVESHNPRLKFAWMR